jgi:hypothetical protein
MSIFHKIYNFFNKPQIALLTIIIFLVIYILLTEKTSKFSNNFLLFGPKKNDENKYAKFAGVELDTWKKIIIVYVMIFLASVFQTYYKNVIHHGVDKYIYYSDSSEIPFSKLWAYIILLVNPFIDTLLYVIKFFATATFQLQFIIPQFIGSYIVNLPYIVHMLKGKKFIQYI